MTQGKPESDGACELHEPDAAETLRLVMRGSASAHSCWHRLLLAGLCSIGLHLFFLPLLMVIGWVREPFRARRQRLAAL